MIIRVLYFICCLLGMLSCQEQSNNTYQGYIEGEALYLSVPYSGQLIERVVYRGKKVQKGDLLFRLDSNPQALKIKASQAELLEGQKILNDLKNPRRIPEITAINAQIERTKANLALANIRVKRFEKLYHQHAASKDRLDEAKAHYEALQNLKEEQEANLQLAKLGSRHEQINAQEAKLIALKAKFLQDEWELEQKQVHAPRDGVILDTFFEPGEFVPNQRAVLALLPPENIRVEFFVPVEHLAALHLQQPIEFTCFGCKINYKATITYISPEAEYIPPLVYSRENDQKLVFRIQAAIEHPDEFKPGQPVLIMKDKL